MFPFEDMKRLMFLMAAGILAVACGRKGGEGVVPVPAPESIRTDAFAPLVRSVELLPLETTEELLGDFRNLEMTRDSGSGWIVYDMANGAIHHYDAAGKFLGRIGNRGRGPQEFTDVFLVQVRDGQVNVFSRSADEFLVYREDGTFVRREPVGAQTGQGALVVKEGLLAYTGYSWRGDKLLKLISPDGTQTEFIPKKNPNMLSFFGTPSLFEMDGQVFITPEWDDTVYRYKDGTVERWVSFDLGRASLDRSFWEEEDPATAMMTRLQTLLAFVPCYWENRQLKIAGVMFNGASDSFFCYGIVRHGMWSWFRYDRDKALSLVKCIDGDALVCLVDPDLLDTLDPALREKISNPEVLEGIPDNSNYLIAKVRLK